MEKTYVFDTNDGGNNMAGLIASLCQNRGLDPNMVMAMMNNRNGYGDCQFGWFWIVILMIFGWGGFGNGFGNNFGGRGNAQGFADLGNLINNDAGRELLMQAINGNGTAIGQLSTKLGCDYNALSGAIQNLSTQLCQLGNTVGMGQKDIITAIMQGNNSLAAQLCECCCSTKTLITEQGYQNQLQTLNQTNVLQGAINNVNTGMERGFSSVAYETASQTCEIKNAIAAQTQVINDKFCQLEMREMARENRDLRDQVQAYQLSASQQAQTANIVNQIRPCPTPAYIVANPYGCGCNNNYNNCNNCNC